MSDSKFLHKTQSAEICTFFSHFCLNRLFDYNCIENDLLV